jgi:hypothetical protein
MGITKPIAMPWVDAPCTGIETCAIKTVYHPKVASRNIMQTKPINKLKVAKV